MPGPPKPRLRAETIREALRVALRGGPHTARDLSKEVGIPERDVPGHLEHLERSGRRRDERLVIEGCRCLDCGFTPERHPLKRPGHCPRCRGRRLSFPRFELRAR